MIADAFAAFADMFAPASRTALWKSLGATAALLALLWAALDMVIVGHIALATPWLATLLSILTGVGLFVALAFLVAPVASGERPERCRAIISSQHARSRRGYPRARPRCAGLRPRRVN